MSDLKARLDKRGTHAVCGVIDCGYQLARVVDSRGVFHGLRYAPRAVCFGPGWRVSNGHWRVSNEARERIRSRRRPREKRQPVEGHHVDDGKLVGKLAWVSPALVTCPRCGFVQELDFDSLSAVSETSDGTSKFWDSWMAWPWEPDDVTDSPRDEAQRL